MAELKQTIPSLVGFATKVAAEHEESVSIGYKINCNDDDPLELKPIMISSILDDFVYPEIMKRIKNGIITYNFKLTKVHIIMYIDDRNNEILLNEDVRFTGLVQFQDQKREMREEIKVYEIKDILGIYPSEQNDPNAAHIMLFKFKNKWLISCNFFYNKKKNKYKLNNAKGFFKAAIICMGTKLWGPFIDNLFSATELAINSILLHSPMGKYSKRQSHDKTNELLEIYTKLGNLDERFWTHYKVLKDLRLQGRYLNGIPTEFSITLSKAENLKLITEELIRYVDKMLETIDYSTKLPYGEYINFGKNALRFK